MYSSTRYAHEVIASEHWQSFCARFAQEKGLPVDAVSRAITLIEQNKLSWAVYLLRRVHPGGCMSFLDFRGLYLADALDYCSGDRILKAAASNYATTPAMRTEEAQLRMWGIIRRMATCNWRHDFARIISSCGSYGYTVSRTGEVRNAVSDRMTYASDTADATAEHFPSGTLDAFSDPLERLLALEDDYDRQREAEDVLERHRGDLNARQYAVGSFALRDKMTSEQIASVEGVDRKAVDGCVERLATRLAALREQAKKDAARRDGQ